MASAPEGAAACGVCRTVHADAGPWGPEVLWRQGGGCCAGVRGGGRGPAQGGGAGEGARGEATAGGGGEGAAGGGARRGARGEAACPGRGEGGAAGGARGRPPRPPGRPPLPEAAPGRLPGTSPAAATWAPAATLRCCTTPVSRHSVLRCLMRWSPNEICKWRSVGGGARGATRHLSTAKIACMHGPRGDRVLWTHCRQNIAAVAWLRGFR